MAHEPRAHWELWTLRRSKFSRGGWSWRQHKKSEKFAATRRTSEWRWWPSLDDGTMESLEEPVRVDVKRLRRKILCSEDCKNERKMYAAGNVVEVSFGKSRKNQNLSFSSTSAEAREIWNLGNLGKSLELWAWKSQSGWKFEDEFCLYSASIGELINIRFHAEYQFLSALNERWDIKFSSP